MPDQLISFFNNWKTFFIVYKISFTLFTSSNLQYKLILYFENRTYGPRSEKTCLRVFANNTGEDQPAHSRSLISAFVIPFLKSIRPKLASSEISIFYLVSVAEQASLKLTLSETPKTGLVASRPI